MPKGAKNYRSGMMTDKILYSPGFIMEKDMKIREINDYDLQPLLELYTQLQTILCQ